MTPEQTDLWLKLQERQAIALESIVRLLQQICLVNQPKSQSYSAKLQKL